MLESNLFEDLKNNGNDYLLKGQHIIKKFAKEELNENLELCICPNEKSEDKCVAVSKILWKKINAESEKLSKVNFIFTGNVDRISEYEMKKWFLNIIGFHSNKFTTFFYNKKLKILQSIVNWFFSVFNKDFHSVQRFNLQYHYYMSSDVSSSNFKCDLIWFDHNLSAKGNSSLSTYKVFYILAAALELPVINSSTSRLVEKRFTNESLLASLKSEKNNISKLLLEINFSQSQIKQIFDLLVGLIELSQYRAQGDGKKLEFIGTGHLKKAAECLLIKEKQLRDFLIVEYTWVDNKKKLKLPEIINSEIDSFISAMYNVVVIRILERFNNFAETDPKSFEFIDLQFSHAPSLPAFDKENIFNFSDYYQYYISSLIQSIAPEKIREQVKQFLNSGLNNVSTLQITEPRKPLDPKISFNTITNLINEYKNAKNPTEYIQKLEKSVMKEIRIFKINNEIFIDIYIPECVSFVRFRWESFVEDSSQYCLKQLNSFMKLTNNLIINNYQIKKLSFRTWTSEDLLKFADINHVFNKSEFFIHLLIDEDSENGLYHPLKNQILNNNIQYLQITTFKHDIIQLKDFVAMYGILFLKYGDHSRTDAESACHAIHRLDLKEAWCCLDFIHLLPSQIEDLNLLLEKYNQNIIKVQGYGRVIVAKIKLKQLKSLSDQYKEEYLTSLAKIAELSHMFIVECIPIISVDKENIDLQTFTNLIPTSISLKTGDHENARWLNVTIMSETQIIHKFTFVSNKVCLFYSNDEIETSENCVNIRKCLPEDIQSTVSNKFILKISNQQNGDVLFDVKSRIPLYVWNVETEINKKKREKYPLSRGYLLTGKQYRLFQAEYIIKTLAYDTINQVVYDSFDEILQRSSVGIIIQSHPLFQNALTKSPLWMLITNCLPFINLGSTDMFNLVEKQMKIIDKTECSKFVEFPFLRPRNDWIFENVSMQLLNRHKDADVCDFRNSIFHERLSNTKVNYKTAKYLMKK